MGLVKRGRRSLVVTLVAVLSACFLLAGITPASAAPTPTGDWRMKGSFKNSVLSKLKMVNVTGINGDTFFDTGLVDGLVTKVLYVPQDAGSMVTGISKANRSVYSVDIYFQDQIPFFDFTYCRLMSFGPNDTDTGLYVYDHRLDLFPYVLGTDPLSPQQWAHVLVTRNSAGLVKVYGYGILLLTYDDSGTDEYLLRNGEIVFFKDDTNPAETCPLGVSNIRIYNRVVTPGAIYPGFN